MAEAVWRVVAEGHAMPFVDPEPVEAARAQAGGGGGALTASNLAGVAANVKLASTKVCNHPRCFG